MRVIRCSTSFCVVVCITGNGLKTPEVLEGAEAPSIHLQRASLSAFEDVLEGAAA